MKVTPVTFCPGSFQITGSNGHLVLCRTYNRFKGVLIGNDRFFTRLAIMQGWHRLTRRKLVLFSKNWVIDLPVALVTNGREQVVIREVRAVLYYQYVCAAVT